MHYYSHTDLYLLCSQLHGKTKETTRNIWSTKIIQSGQRSPPCNDKDYEFYFLRTFVEMMQLENQTIEFKLELISIVGKVQNCREEVEKKNYLELRQFYILFYET